jgi:hypothetical protein
VKKLAGSYWRKYTGFWRDPDDLRTNPSKASTPRTKQNTQSELEAPAEVRVVKKEDLPESLKRQAPPKKRIRLKTKKKSKKKSAKDRTKKIRR